MAVLTSLAMVVASFVSAPSVRAATPASAADAAGQAVEITLITGDRVRYVAGPDGKQQVTVVEAVSTTFRGLEPPEGGLYLFPDIAEPYVASGVLDRELFNIEYLATNGYDDAHMQRLPVIVDYAGDGPAAATRARGGGAGLAASRTGPVLESIGAVGLSVDKAHADRFWESLAPQPETKGPGLLAAGELSGAVDKVWLDRKVTVTLDESVPLIGAPEAWEAGFDGAGVTVAVLDTGIDATHPDLDGKVVASKSFVSDTPKDGHGHGTHVASTIVGSGAASDGKYKGVAPGADLVVGKVLDDGGSGQSSEIIEGMEWAAQEQDADVISMSLGSQGDFDGTDPMSLAVNQLTASTGSLFVIAAGNSGPGPETLGSPGVADAALTVAASNEGDALDPIASFSSRGPRIDGVLKPDIAAPGVNIVAARAAGTDMCGTGCSIPGDGPVNEHYYSVSGTSMATPHVAGAAVILAQQHPDWTAEQLKTTLMSTSLGLSYLGVIDYPANAQGAGRVDVARAVSQQLRTDTANISPGILERDEPAHVVPITYHNDSTSDLTVSVDALLQRGIGAPATEGTISLDRDTLTVPAGGSATVTVTIDASTLDGSAQFPFGAYNGFITASTQAGDSLRTPIGVTFSPPLSELTIRLIKPAPVSELPWFFHGFGWSALRLDDSEVPWYENAIAWHETSDPQVVEANVLLPDGIYSIAGDPDWQRVPGRGMRNQATIVEPEVTINGDTAITIDMRKLVPVTVTAEEPTEQVWRVYGHRRTTQAGSARSSWTLNGMPEAYQQWRYPTERVTVGDLSIREGFMLAQPEVLLQLRAGGRRLTLQPAYPDFPADIEDHQYPKFTRDIDTVLATEADIEAGRDVRGALVLFNMPHDLLGYFEERCLPPLAPEGGALCAVYNRAQQAADAGAAGVLLTTPKIGLQYWGFLNQERYASQLPVPVAWLDTPQAERLASLTQSDKPVEVGIDATVETAYEYKLWFRHTDQVPSDMTYEVDSSDLKRVDVGYHGPESTVPGLNSAGESMHAFWPDENLSFGTVRYFDAPTRRAEYYLPTGPEAAHILGYSWFDNTSGISKSGQLSRTVVDTESETTEWGTVVTPGQARVDDIRSGLVFAGCAVCRQDDDLWVALAPTMGDGRQFWHGGYDQSVRLFRADGTEVPQSATGGFPLPPESGRYRLEQVQTSTTNDSPYSRQVTTVWDFTATAKPTENEVELPYGKPRLFDPDPAAWQPVIFLNYEIPLELDNTARAGQPIWITVHAAAGEPGSGADIAGLKLQASFDDGETWAESLVVRPVGDGTFQVLIKHPNLSETTGAVTLRTEAWDEAGNRVTQTVDRAYGLR